MSPRGEIAIPMRKNIAAFPKLSSRAAAWRRPGDRRPLLFEESRECADPFFRIAKDLMCRGAIGMHACDIKLGLANVDADTHNRWLIHAN
jgi:hypothetical protein